MSIVVANEADFIRLDIRTVLRDRNGDVFEKVTERGVEMTGVVGKFGPTWIAYPADVLYDPELPALSVGKDET